MSAKKIIVLGGGGSGIAAARLAMAQGAEVMLLDTATSPKCAAELQEHHIPCITGESALAYNKPAELAVISPGVPADSALAKLGERLAKKVVGELAYGASFIHRPMLAITGTNGKTTTVEMLEHLLNSCGRKAVACGNIGLPLSQVALSSEQPELLVVEVSSFQLEHAEGFQPTAAALLNITPDHLSRHHSTEEYVRLKLSLAEKLPENGCFIVSRQLERQYELRNRLAGKVIMTFGSDDDADYALQGGNLLAHGKVVLNRDELPYKGEHNYANALAAMALAEQVGIAPERAAQALRTFHIGEHRLQVVHKSGNLVFIDDSKATNVDALCVALRALAPEQKPIALIAGGLDKGCSLCEAIPLLKQNVKQVFLIGSCADRLAIEWGGAVQCIRCSTLDEAVQSAAESLQPAGGTVLLSPACASMDMFKDYIERGELFQQAAKKIIG